MNNANNTNDVLDYFFTPAFLQSAAIIIVASILLWVIKQYLIKKVAYSGKDEQHKNTFIGMIFNVLQYLVIVIAAVMVLKANGVNVGSILAGLGIVATIIGLALQDTLKDIIAGINIYKDNLFIGLTVKCIDYFENSLPIINNIKGDTWDMVEKNKLGINVRNNVNCSKEDIIKLRLDNEHIFRFFKESFSEEAFINKCSRAINEVIG